MVTRAVGGFTSTALTALPSWSIGTSGTSWSMSIGGAWMITEARTATTVDTTDLGPVIVTVVGHDRRLAEGQSVGDRSVLDAHRDVLVDDLIQLDVGQ